MVYPRVTIIRNVYGHVFFGRANIRLFHRVYEIGYEKKFWNLKTGLFICKK